MERQETDRGLPPPPPYKWRNIAIVLLIVGIVVGAIGAYAVASGQIISLQTQIQNLETQVTGLQADKTQLQGQVSSLQGQVSSLQADKTKLQVQVTSLESEKTVLQAQITQLQISYNSLQAQYQQLQGKYQYSPTIPYTLIWNGTVEWFFKDTKGNVLSWQMPIDTYRIYANKPKSSDSVRLAFENGTVTSVLDIRSYIEPQFFSNVIVNLTKGRTDEDFVREVDNVKNQIVVYGSGMGDFYRWPAETLTECRGECGDTTILMASMIVEGNSLANYGMKIYIWYVDAHHITGNPTQVNHAIVEVDFKDGTQWVLETTTNYFYNYLSYQSVYGWKYDVTTQGIGG